MIHFNKLTKQFDLVTKNNQFSLGILESGHIVELYFGKKIAHNGLDYCIENNAHASYMADTDSKKGFQLELLPLLFPSFGNPDLRSSAYQFYFQNGEKLSDFRYNSHHIYRGKKEITDLPASFGNKEIVTTIDISLKDDIAQMEMIISISTFDDYDVFTQHVKVQNFSKETVTIEKLLSLNLDFMRDDFDLCLLTGAWSRETHLQRHPLHRGIQGIDSKRGASGHGQNPFVALVDPGTTLDDGQVIGANLIYSGNFVAHAEVDMYQQTRLQLGINPHDFEWHLLSGKSFETPEAVLVFAENGLNKMAQTFHRFYKECLINPNFADKERPILINNWEATYFDFNRPKLLSLANEAASLGIELFVLDDGWFGNRHSDKSALGDWQPNEKKLGGSLQSLIREIKGKGLLFGLWVEPEMVSKDSELFRTHPDWIIYEKRRVPQESRNQYVLDLSKIEVQQHIISFMTELLSSHSIDYIKWDMNRNITDAGSSHLLHSKELGHRYILGLYRILDQLTSAFPHVLFESCAGGGGRYDPGMLFYTPQIWPSDDTDAIERLSIQSGSSLVYPPSTMGCHISAIPNHQVARNTSLSTRSIVAQQGNLGYELDLTQLTFEEKQEIRKQIILYKNERKLLQFGMHTQLTVNDSSNECAWQKQNSQTIVVSHVYKLAKPNVLSKRIKLKQLPKKCNYKLQGTNKVYTSDELMIIGLSLPNPTSDFMATRFTLEKLNEK